MRYLQKPHLHVHVAALLPTCVDRMGGIVFFTSFLIISSRAYIQHVVRTVPYEQGDWAMRYVATNAAFALALLSAYGVGTWLVLPGQVNAATVFGVL